jgi:hypothetical protein
VLVGGGEESVVVAAAGPVEVDSRGVKGDVLLVVRGGEGELRGRRGDLECLGE